MFAQPNTFLHGLSSTLLLGSSDEESCVAVNMVPSQPQESTANLQGSLSRLWPLFGTFCLSDFVETVSCAVQGRPVAPETGMTLFKHSLAFAEADAAISNQLGWSLFSNGTTVTTQSSLGTSIAITRAMIMNRVNTSPEVLLVAFLSAMSHITSHVLGIFNLQSKFRLLSTGFWGLCFMTSIIWSAVTFSLEDASAQGLLRYPTVCIIGFIPHVLVLGGMIVCCFIYLLALILCALSEADLPQGARRRSLRERIVTAHNNMQANVSLSDIRIRMDMDFYTALLRAGFAAISMASEAVYLNEDRRVLLKNQTWLEEDRLRELDELRMQWVGAGIPGSRFDSVGTIGLVPIKEGQAGATSGYAREKAAQKISKTGNGNRRIRDGVGAAESSGRWLMALEYIMHINRLIITAWAIGICRVLAFVGVRNRPRWLRWLSQRPKAESAGSRRSARGDRGPPAEWMTVRNGTGVIQRNDRVDVELEVRRWLHRNTQGASAAAAATPEIDEDEIDATLYSWWLRGGWWGSTDASGDYAPPNGRDENGLDDPDFDATSLISTAETTDVDSAWESEPDRYDDGQKTPTQQSPNPFASRATTRESTPIVDSPLAMADLSRLLHPTSPEDRDEARALAAHLNSDRIMTRSAYRLSQQRQRAQVLASGPRSLAYRSGVAGPSAKLSPEEEALALEHILLTRRAAATTGGSAPTEQTDVDGSSSWATGAAGLGAEGPQCVVCQCSPRTIIVWPCRCLSLCDDCRVSLAMNNFDNCVCCRREVISFSRIFVP
jgi:hypothetical protein